MRTSRQTADETAEHAAVNDNADEQHMTTTDGQQPHDPYGALDTDPSKRTLFQREPERIERLCEQLQAGLPLTAAAHIAGLNLETLRKWITQGEHDIINERQTPHSALTQRIHAAAAYAHANAVASVTRAFDRNWQAAAWFLERRFPSDWGARAQLDVDARVEMQVSVDDARDRLLERLSGLKDRVVPAVPVVVDVAEIEAGGVSGHSSVGLST